MLRIFIFLFTYNLCSLETKIKRLACCLGENSHYVPGLHCLPVGSWTCLQFTAENNAECSELQIPKPGNTHGTALPNLYEPVSTNTLRYHCMEVVVCSAVFSSTVKVLAGSLSLFFIWRVRRVAFPCFAKMLEADKKTRQVQTELSTREEGMRTEL